MNIGDWLQEATRKLEKAGIESARLDAELLAAHALGTSRDAILAHPEFVAPKELDGLLERRANGEPIAYIVGFREFYGRNFFVDPRVLIPRPETETLVEIALEKIDAHSVVFDVGTGSGNIGITLALERSDLAVFGSDTSLDALQVARHNADNLQARISFVRMDLLSGVRPGSLDAVVSNPPYVDPSDARLEKTVRKYEPEQALFSEHGIAHIKRLVAQSKSTLRDNGTLIFEFGDGQTKNVIEMLSGWNDVKIFKDLAGRDRVAFARKAPI